MLITDQDVELSLPPAPWLPAYCHVSHHDNKGLDLRNDKPAPSKYFLLEELLWSWSFTAIETLIKTDRLQ